MVRRGEKMQKIKIVYKLTGVEIKDTREYFITTNGDVYKLVEEDDGIDLIQQLHLEVKVELSLN